MTVASRTGGTVAVIDTEKLALRTEKTARPAPAPAPETFPWALVAGAFAVALAIPTLAPRAGEKRESASDTLPRRAGRSLRATAETRLVSRR